MSTLRLCGRAGRLFRVVIIVTIISAVSLLRAPPGVAAPLQVMRGQVPAAVANLNLQPLEHLAGTNRLNVAIALPGRNPEALSALLQHLYDPASPSFRQFLTCEQFTEAFGPSEQDYQAVIDFANSHGLTVTATYPNRKIVDVSASVVEIEAAFHVTMQVYQHPTENRTFYAPDVEPSLNLAVPVLGISGLNNYALPRPRLQARLLNQAPGTPAPPATPLASAAPSTGSGIGGSYMGYDFRSAYVPGAPFVGAGQTVGLLEFDGYNANDIAYYETKAGLPSVTLSNVLLNGVSGQPSGSSGQIEVSLDIEAAIAMAPGLSRVFVYEASNWHDMLNRMASDNVAKQLSCSWYINGGTADLVADRIFQQMAAQGQAFFSASGDSDAHVGLIDFPGDTPVHHAGWRNYAHHDRPGRSVGFGESMELGQRRRQRRRDQHLLPDSELPDRHQHGGQPGVHYEAEHARRCSDCGQRLCARHRAGLQRRRHQLRGAALGRFHCPNQPGRTGQR